MNKTIAPSAPRANLHESASYQSQVRCPDGYRVGYCGVLLSNFTYMDYSKSSPVKAIYARRAQNGRERQTLVDIMATDDLWLRFVQLRTEKDMAAFAGRFGLLESTPHLELVIPMRKNANWSDEHEATSVIARRIWAKESGLGDLSDDQLKQSHRVEWLRDITVSGEPVALWKAHLSEMRPLVRIYNAINDFDYGYLEEKFQWKASNESRGYFDLRYQDSPEEFLVKKDLLSRGSSEQGSDINMLEHALSVGFTDYWDNKIDPAISKRFREENELITPAKMFLSSRVNSFLRDEIHTGLVASLDLSEYRLRIVPANLIAAIWYQFAQAIAASQKIAVCEVCGEFYAKRNRRGSEQRYCSNACKMKSYRQRKETIAA